MGLFYSDGLFNDDGTILLAPIALPAGASLMSDGVDGQIYYTLVASLLTAASGVLMMRPDLTSLTGVGAESLAAITTADGSAPKGVIVDASAGGPSRMWELRSGTDANDPTNGIVRPNDYNGSTNQKVWKSI